MALAMAFLVLAAVAAFFFLRKNQARSDSSVQNPGSRPVSPTLASATVAAAPSLVPPTRSASLAAPRGETPVASAPSSAPSTAPQSTEPPVLPSDASTNETAQSLEEKFAGRLRHGSEQLLSMIISTDETGVPPLPISPEDEEALRKDLLIAITNDIVIFDDEDSKTQEVKERVANAKSQLAEILKNGGNVVAAIREYKDFVNEGIKIRSEVLEKIGPEIDAITNDAEAVEYVESVNKALEKEEIPPIRLEEVGFETVEEPSDAPAAK